MSQFSVSVSKETYRAIKRAAQRRGTTMGALVAESLAHSLSPDPIPCTVDRRGYRAQGKTPRERIYELFELHRIVRVVNRHCGKVWPVWGQP